MAFADQINDGEEPSAYPKEEEHLSNAVLKRRNEFIAGRRCARAALAKIGISPCALAPDKDRVPQWPAGAVGSITHSNRLCCAVIGHSDKVTGLGVDLETTTHISSQVIERIVHSMEADFVGADQANGSLIFSAKEAFFKAQFPIWNAWPNFDDLAFHVDTSAHQLRVIHVADHLPSDLQVAAKSMQFRYAFIDNYVLTLCWLYT